MDERKNRLAEALMIRGMKQVELAEKTKLTPAQINSWKNNRWQPKQSALHLMAKALNVSELWLAGYDVPMERPAEQVRMDEVASVVQALREDESLMNLVGKIVRLSKEHRQSVEAIVNYLSEPKAPDSDADSDADSEQEECR